MVTFKCPVCNRLHVMNSYDTEYICNNSVSQKKKFQDVDNEDMLTRNNWNLDEWNTKKDAYRDVVITDIKPMPSDKNKYAGGTKSHNY